MTSSTKPQRVRAGTVSRPDRQRTGKRSLVQHAWFMLLIALAIVVCAVRPVGDPDVWFHMAFGRYFLDAGEIPRTDIFSYTAAGHEWISSGWLSSVALEALFRAAGPAGLAWLVAAVLIASYLLVYLTAAYRYRNAGSMALLLLAGVLVAYQRFSPRPDLFSQLGIAALVVLLIWSDKPSRRLWALPPLFLVWANLHVGFIAGLEIVAIYGAWIGYCWYRSREKLYLLAFVPCALCFLTWMLNPYGPDLVSLVEKNRAIPDENRRNFEWMPLVAWPKGHFSWRGITAFALPSDVYAGIFALGGLVLLAVVRRKHPIPFWHYAVLVLFTAHAVFQRRQLGLAALVLPAILAPHLAGLDSLLTRRRFLLPALVTAVAFLLCGMRFTGKLAMPGGLPQTGIECRMLPCRALEFMKRTPPPDPIYNTYYFGGYLLYFSPERKVFYDGRLDVYGPATWNDYWAAEEGHLTIDQVTARYGLNTFVLDARDAAGNPRHLASRLSAHPDWGLVYFDDNYVIYVRRQAETADYLRTHELRFATPFAPERLGAALSSPATRAIVLQEVKRALEISGASGSAHALAALAYLETGDRQRAQQHLKSARERGVDLSFPAE